MRKFIKIEKFKHISIVLALFLFSFLVYKLVFIHPRNWYDHYLHLAHSFLLGRVDVPTLPEFYHDVIKFSGKTYLPFPPGPALTLIPFILFSSTITQQETSVIIGALNVTLVFILLSKFTKTKWAMLISIFFGFGTVAFWSAIVGTTWYFAQNAAFLFLTLSLILHFSKKDFLSGIVFMMAVLCRYPLLFSSLFFIISLFLERDQKEKGLLSYKRLINFLIGFAPVFLIQSAYSYLRFGDIFKTGYYEVYKQYVNGPIPQTVLQLIKHDFPTFGYLDLRNIPLHIFTFLIMPPVIKLNPFSIIPSPYGMGIFFTSPFLFLSFLKPFENKQKILLWLGIITVAFIDFLHYMQGWVQFGYRFVLDFLPFLLILLALNFKPTQKYSHRNLFYFVIFIISLIVSSWGAVMGVKLGW